MALSTKVAMLMSLGFISGVTWLVSMVARPMVDLPTPLVVSSTPVSTRPPAAKQTPVRPVSTVSQVAGRFERRSASEAAPVEVVPETPPLIVAEVPHVDQVALNSDAAVIPEAPVLNEPAVGIPAVAHGEAREPVATGSPLAASAEVAMQLTEAELPAAETPGGARLVANISEDFQHPLAAANVRPRSAPAVAEYTVRKGDSLVKISRRVWKRDDSQALEMLLAANPDLAKRKNRIYPGEVLRIPDLDEIRRGAAVELAVEQASEAPQFTAAEPTAAPRYREYTVRKSDSLARIAKRFLNDGNRWRELARINGLKDADKIYPGRRIKVPIDDRET